MEGVEQCSLLNLKTMGELSLRVTSSIPGGASQTSLGKDSLICFYWDPIMSPALCWVLESQ